MVFVSAPLQEQRAPLLHCARTCRSLPPAAFFGSCNLISISAQQQNSKWECPHFSSGRSKSSDQGLFLKLVAKPDRNRLQEFHAQRSTKKTSNLSPNIDAGGQQNMWVLCGFGYSVQGFRCFPWLALNYHLAHGLGLSPSTLQLVQNIGNLPMVAKPLYGVLSDVIYIGSAHRIPYISFGVLLQLVSWGTLALIPIGEVTFCAQMACILLGNLGASFTEVASDALVAEFSTSQKDGTLQSYAFMALVAGGILGNFSGGFVLLRSHPKVLFFTFALLLVIQLGLSLAAECKEGALNLPSNTSNSLTDSSVLENISKQFSHLMTALNEKNLYYPLSWIAASVALVPLLSGSVFCYQTQFLKLDPAIIGLSKVIGQLMVLSATLIYNRYLKRVPFRKLVLWLQIFYALSLLSDLFLVKQINIRLGISNEAYVLCLSALAEAVAQFKILPFSVLLSSLCPPGCEGSLFAFFGSALCLSSILSGISGVGLASLIGTSSGDYSKLWVGVILQFLAALIPLRWISRLPAMHTSDKVIKRCTRGSGVR